jgi:hypothetical protein
MGMGLGELVLLGVVVISIANGVAAPIVGIVRAVGRRRRRARSTGAVVWSSINVGLFVLAGAWGLAAHVPPVGAIIGLPLNGAWLFLAVQANRATAAATSPGGLGR